MFKKVLTVFAVVLVVAQDTTGTGWRGLLLNGEPEKAEDKSLKEKRQPVTRSECQVNEFSCTLDTCIQLDEVCDTHPSCPEGDDELNCPTNCTGPHQFKCENSSKCIGIIDKCDGFNDCTDYSDEEFCANFECPAGRFRCNSSDQCIHPTSVCDGVKDCRDASDEHNCLNCSSAEFKCTDRSKCIHLDYVCDEVHDCNDFSDETHCSCRSQDFKCTTGVCIPAFYICDGYNDCGDLGDERGCPTEPSSVCHDVLAYQECSRVNKTTHPVCLIPNDADKFCREFCGLCQ